jgi:hypothetical protein
MTQLDLKSPSNGTQMLSPSTHERRDFSRIKIEGITLVKTDSTALPIINGKLNDVSASGLKITLDTPLTIGSEVRLSIFIEDEDLIFLVSGVILWCAVLDNESVKPRYHCGVEILYEDDGADFYDWRALFIA